jgi:hypothetical protein
MPRPIEIPQNRRNTVVPAVPDFWRPASIACNAVNHPIGRLIYVRDRSVGAKGSSPWSDVTTGMIL